MTEARASVTRTPDLLPVLREAGVVDSGALGLCVCLEGTLHYLRGEPLPAVAEDAGHIAREWLDSHHGTDADGEDGQRFGYCVEFAIRGDGGEAGDLRARLQALGNSVLVVGDTGFVRIHVHTDDPGAAVQLGTRRGTLTRVKIDNMDEQAGRLAERTVEVAAGPFAVVAVALGRGLAEALQGAGASRVVQGGQTMNPSTRELLAAIESAPLPHVVLLPNNKNIIWTAEQAARLSKKVVDVIATRSVPEGIAALLALNPDDEPAEALQTMRDAVSRVHTVEVTRAARSVRINGLPVVEGDPIALIDDDLAASASSPDEAAVAALERLGVGAGSLLTVYVGEAVDADTAAKFEQRLQDRFIGAETEIVRGGQPFYDYIVPIHRMQRR